MLIQIPKPICSTHRLPFAFICDIPECKCSVRLCSVCQQQHPKLCNSSHRFSTQKEFQAKLRDSFKSAHAQSGIFKDYNIELKEQIVNRRQQAKNTVKTIKIELNREKEEVFEETEKATEKFRQTIKNIQQSNLRAYLSNICKGNLLGILLNLNSRTGLEKTKENGVKAALILQIYQNLLKDGQKFGSNTQTLLEGSGLTPQNLMKSKLRDCISKWQTNKLVQLIQSTIPIQLVQSRIQTISIPLIQRKDNQDNASEAETTNNPFCKKKTPYFSAKKKQNADDSNKQN